MRLWLAAWQKSRSECAENGLKHSTRKKRLTASRGLPAKTSRPLPNTCSNLPPSGPVVPKSEPHLKQNGPAEISRAVFPFPLPFSSRESKFNYSGSAVRRLKTRENRSSQQRARGR
jgi:hypothetical protein